MRYRLYIFDLDGTLVDTSPGIMETIRFVEREMGVPPIPEEQLRRFIGPPLEDSFARYHHAGPEQVTRMVELYRQKYGTVGVNNGVVYPGIPEILGEIRAAGALSAVATLKHYTMTEKTLVHFELTPRFDAIAAPEGPNTSKATLIRQAMERLGWDEPSSVLMIGDSRYDGEGALEAGVDFVPLTYGFGFDQPGSLDGLPTVYTAETPEGLVEFLRECLK